MFCAARHSIVFPPSPGGFFVSFMTHLSHGMAGLFCAGANAGKKKKPGGIALGVS